MKFLIIQKVKQEIPLEKWAKLFPLQFKYFEKLEKEHVLEVYYHLIGELLCDFFYSPLIYSLSVCRVGHVSGLCVLLEG